TPERRKVPLCPFTILSDGSGSPGRVARPPRRGFLSPTGRPQSWAGPPFRNREKTMNPRTRVIGLLAGAALVLGLARPAHAERVRFHYAPNQICASSPAVPTGPGVVGERVSAFGGTGPTACQLRPN